MVINADGPETRVALVEKGQLAELYIERRARARHRRQHLQGPRRARAARHAGGLRRHRRSRRRPSSTSPTCAARPRTSSALFVDERRASAQQRRATKRRERRSGARIEDLLKEGQEILVQVAKEPIGTKGARITALHLAARPPPGVHADGRPRRHLAPHRLGQGAASGCARSSTRCGRRARASSCAPSPRACRETELQRRHGVPHQAVERDPARKQRARRARRRCSTTISTCCCARCATCSPPTSTSSSSTRERSTSGS